MDTNHTETLLIVGIDPGTTLGYALLDLDGNVIELNSSKLLNLNSLIALITETGLPVIVAADKNPAPGFVQKAATKLGARLIHPEQNMLVLEKKALTKGFVYRNDHQRDALSGALYAHKKLKPLLNKIDNFLRKSRQFELELPLKRMLLQEQTISVKTAASFLGRPKPEKQKIVQKIAEEKNFGKEYFRLLDRCKAVEKENRLIREQRKGLRKQLEELKKPKILPKGRPSAKARKSLMFKDKTIFSLQKQKDELGRQILGLKSCLSHLNKIILEKDRYVIVKKLDNLSFREYQKKNPVLNITKGDILLIKDASVVSQKTIDLLSEIIDIIITGRPTTMLSPFTVINPKDLNIKETEYFVAVPKNQLSKALSGADMFKRIVTGYKKERLK